MTIEWNKVTWYSKLLAVILFVAVFALAFYLGSQYASIKSNIIGSGGDVVVSNTDELTLGVGETGRIGGLDITFNAFVQDSRCPIDVQCIQAGALNINVTLKSGPHVETRNMPSDEAPYVFNEYQISIVDVAPPAHSQKQIDPDDYHVKFHVYINKF